MRFRRRTDPFGGFEPGRPPRDKFRIGLSLTLVFSLILSAVTILRTGPGLDSLVAILFFSYLVILSILVSWYYSRNSSQFDWRDFMKRVAKLTSQRVILGKVGTDLTIESSRRTLAYDMSVRYLYLMALSQGRKDIADEFLMHYKVRVKDS